MFSWSLTGLALLPIVVWYGSSVHLTASHVFSRIYAVMPNLRAFRPLANVLIKAFNDSAALRAGTDRLKLFDPDPAVARGFVETLLRRWGCTLRPLGSGRQGYSVTAVDRPHRIGVLLGAIGKATAIAFKDGIVPVDPSLINGWNEEPAIVAELRREKAKNGRAAGEIRRDTGKFFRIPAKIWVPVRTEDVRWFQAIMAALVSADVMRSIIALVRLLGLTGMRASEGVAFTYWGWWTGSKMGNKAHVRNKNGGDVEDKLVVYTASLAREFAAMTDAFRAPRDPVRRPDGGRRDMAYFRELGRRVDAGGPDAAAAEAELRATRVFVNEKGGDLTYKVAQKHTKRAFRAAEEPIPATLHWLRHEYVFSRMREIDKFRHIELEWHAKRKALAAYMGWKSGEVMLLCYDAFNDERIRLEDAVDHLENREREMDAQVSTCGIAAGLAGTPVPAAVVRPRNAALRSLLEF